MPKVSYITYLEFVLVHLQHSFGQEAVVDSHQSQAQWEARQSQVLEEPGEKKKNPDFSTTWYFVFDFLTQQEPGY